MIHKLANISIAGFAMSEAQPGQYVTVRESHWVTSENELFYLYAEHFSRLITSQVDDPYFRDRTHSYLLVIHPDNTADLYLEDDLNITALVKVNKAVLKNDSVYAHDIEEIERVTFTDIHISTDDQVVFLKRSGWRFGIFFNLSRQIDIPTMQREIADLLKTLSLVDMVELVKSKARGENTTIQAIDPNDSSIEAYIITEGKTDVNHLKSAFKASKYDRRLAFSENDKDLGDTGLLRICNDDPAIKGPQTYPVICIFDNDNPDTLKKLNKNPTVEGTCFHYWGNNHYSFVIPIPEARKHYQYVSIEMYYDDEIILRQTRDGKRLHFDIEIKTEIQPGYDNRYIVTKSNEALEHQKKIYSGLADNVEDETGNKVCISKAKFSEMIQNEEPPFENISFENFKLISDIIETIILHSKQNKAES